MTDDKDIKNENRLTTMEGRLKNIEEILKDLPQQIIEGVMLQVQIIKNEAVEQYRREAEAKYCLKSEVADIVAAEKFEKKVCDIISTQVGKWFVTKVVIGSGLIIAILQYALEKIK